MHGWGRHRTWRKLHVALDPQSQQALVVELTTNSVDDAQKVKPLLKAVAGMIRGFTGDGAYDKDKARKALHQRALTQKEDLLQVIPPQRGAVKDKGGKPYLRQRNEAIEAVAEVGREQWKVLSGYHQRSLAETFMFRYKVILGGKLQARKLPNQKTEAKIGSKALNRMLQLAKPQSEKIA